ncbi:MAG: methyltransferase domain-containing protein [archaeon]|nr:methyltransferase domain-containing protein [archaeon]
MVEKKNIFYFLFYPLRLFFDKIFFPVFKKKVARQVSLLCKNNQTILDVGCDDGTTAEKIIQFNPTLKIVGIDIQEDRMSRIPRKIYNGKVIPYPNNSFDVVMALDVLHHTEDVLSLIKEMKRVSRKYIIIKDHMIYSKYSRWLICFTDWISNAPYGIKSSYNFPTKNEWERYFNELNLKVTDKPKVNYGFGINEKYNPIFKLEK